MDELAEHGGVIPYPEGIYPVAVTGIFINGAGFLATSLTMILLLRDWKRLSKSNIIILAISFSQWIFSVVDTFINGAYNVSKGGFALGRVGCVGEGVVLMISCANTVLLLSLYTYERFLAIQNFAKGVKSVSNGLSKQIVIGTCVFSLMGASISACIPLMAGTQYTTYHLSSSKYYCSIKWEGKEGITMMFAIISGLSIAFCGFFMLFAYRYILIFYKNFSKQTIGQMRQAAKSPAKSEKSEGDGPTQFREIQLQTMQVDSLKREKHISLNGAAMTGLFFLAWGPYCCKICFEIFSSTSVPPGIDIFCALMCGLDGLLNPIVLYIFDPSIKEMVNRAFKM